MIDSVAVDLMIPGQDPRPFAHGPKETRLLRKSLPLTVHQYTIIYDQVHTATMMLRTVVRHLLPRSAVGKAQEPILSTVTLEELAHSSSLALESAADPTMTPGQLSRHEKRTEYRASRCIWIQNMVNHLLKHMCERVDHRIHWRYSWNPEDLLLLAVYCAHIVPMVNPQDEEITDIEGADAVRMSEWFLRWVIRVVDDVIEEQPEVPSVLAAHAFVNRQS